VAAVGLGQEWVRVDQQPNGTDVSNIFTTLAETFAGDSQERRVIDSQPLITGGIGFLGGFGGRTPKRGDYVPLTNGKYMALYNHLYDEDTYITGISRNPLTRTSDKTHWVRIDPGGKRYLKPRDDATKKFTPDEIKRIRYGGYTDNVRIEPDEYVAIENVVCPFVWTQTKRDYCDTPTELQRGVMKLMIEIMATSEGRRTFRQIYIPPSQLRTVLSRLSEYTDVSAMDTVCVHEKVYAPLVETAFYVPYPDVPTVKTNIVQVTHHRRFYYVFQTMPNIWQNVDDALNNRRLRVYSHERDFWYSIPYLGIEQSIPIFSIVTPDAIDPRRNIFVEKLFDALYTLKERATDRDVIIETLVSIVQHLGRSQIYRIVDMIITGLEMVMKGGENAAILEHLAIKADLLTMGEAQDRLIESGAAVASQMKGDVDLSSTTSSLDDVDNVLDGIGTDAGIDYLVDNPEKLTQLSDAWKKMQDASQNINEALEEAYANVKHTKRKIELLGDDDDDDSLQLKLDAFTKTLNEVEAARGHLDDLRKRFPVSPEDREAAIVTLKEKMEEFVTEIEINKEIVGQYYDTSSRVVQAGMERGGEAIQQGFDWVVDKTGTQGIVDKAGQLIQGARDRLGAEGVQDQLSDTVGDDPTTKLEAAAAVTDMEEAREKLDAVRAAVSSFEENVPTIVPGDGAPDPDFEPVMRLFESSMRSLEGVLHVDIPDTIDGLVPEPVRSAVETGVTAVSSNVERLADNIPEGVRDTLGQGAERTVDAAGELASQTAGIAGDAFSHVGNRVESVQNFDNAVVAYMAEHEGVDTETAEAAVRNTMATVAATEGLATAITAMAVKETADIEVQRVAIGSAVNAWWDTQWFSEFLDGVDIPAMLTNFALNPMVLINVGLQAMRINRAWQNVRGKVLLTMYTEERAWHYHNRDILKRLACGELTPPRSWEDMERQGFKTEITDEYGTNYTIKDIRQMLFLNRYLDSIVDY